MAFNGSINVSFDEIFEFYGIFFNSTCFNSDQKLFKSNKCFVNEEIIIDCAASQ